MSKEQECYSHFVTGKDALTKEPFYLTKDGAFLVPIFVPVIIPLLYMTGVPFWVSWISHLEPKGISLHWSTLLVIAGLIVGALMWYLRIRAKRSLEIKSLMHSIAHQIRNNFSV